MTRRTNTIIEFGDFQTPEALAREVCAVVARTGVHPASVVEPTCGTGAFLAAADAHFPDASVLLGFDLNPDHLAVARARVPKARIEPGDFFTLDWGRQLDDLPEPILVIGNPPWVTNAALGSLHGANLPVKTTRPGITGFGARTGKSNFDISEWMLTHLIEKLAGRRALLAMLVKQAVARKVLAHAWRNDLTVSEAHLHAIDAARWFDASVDAGLLLCRTAAKEDAQAPRACTTHASLEREAGGASFGWREETLVADVIRYDRWKHLAGPERIPWRSGVKHDAARILELREQDGHLVNGLGELVDVEETCLYALVKGSDLGSKRGHVETTPASPAPTHENANRPIRRLLLPQRRLGEDPTALVGSAPRTWAYLLRHAAHLDRRASSIYRNRPRFSVFGVGDYTFQPWKVAIAGLYKRLAFRVLGPVKGKPVVTDDTTYFLPCRTRAGAHFLADLLASPAAREFYHALIFWDHKRPITRSVLGQLDLLALARHEDREAEFHRHCRGHE